MQPNDLILQWDWYSCYNSDEYTMARASLWASGTQFRHQEATRTKWDRKTETKVPNALNAKCQNTEKPSGEYESLVGCVSINMFKKTYRDTKSFLDCACFPAMSTPSPIPAPFPLSQPAWVLILPRGQIPLQPAFWGCLPSHTSGLALLLRPLHKSASRVKSLNGGSMETTYSDFWPLSPSFLCIISHTDSRAKRVISRDLNAVEPAAKQTVSRRKEISYHQFITWVGIWCTHIIKTRSAGRIWPCQT